MEDIDEDNFDLVDSEGADEGVDYSSNDDDDMLEVTNQVKFNKKTGEVVEVVSSSTALEATEGEEVFVGFEEEEAVGTQFMAVKPWAAVAKVEPSDHPEENPSPPDEDYRLSYVFGYRAEESRNNVFYNTDGNVVYMTACLGVIHNKSDNTQTFFGGNEVDMVEKVHAKDKNNHTDDITSLSISSDRTLACSGQRGSCPTIFVWSATTGEKVARFVLPKGSREVSAIGFSHDAKYLA